MSKKIGKGTVANKIKPKQKVSNKTPVQEKNAQIWFDFQDSKWLRSIKLKNKKFTNFLNNPESCLKSYYSVLNEIIPKIQTEWSDIIGKRYRHCHLLTKEKKELAREVYKKIYNHELGENVPIWQFGFTGGTRLICVHNELQNSLKPIFVDHHHLIYESIKYNQNDYDKYDYCLVCTHKN